MRFPKVLIGDKESNIIFSVLKPETMHCVCTCGKEWHYKDAKYCSKCGRKIEGGR